MNRQQPVPTLEQRRALRDCLERAAMADPRRELSFGERREAIREYREHSWADEWQASDLVNNRAAEIRAEHDELAKPYTGPFVTSYLDALSAAEREALCANGEPVELTTWELIKAEARENETVFLGGALLWLAMLGIGCVLVAVKWGWIA